MKRLALLLLALTTLLAGCQYLPIKSKPLPAGWPLERFSIPTTSRVVQVIDRPNEKLWALFINVQPNGAKPRDYLRKALEKQGYKAAIAPTQDLRGYELFMISPDGVYYATLANGSDGSYPTPTTFKAQYVFEVVSVQHHRMRLGI